jgi:hypothetical protein
MMREAVPGYDRLQDETLAATCVGAQRALSRSPPTPHTSLLRDPPVHLPPRRCRSWRAWAPARTPTPLGALQGSRPRTLALRPAQRAGAVRRSRGAPAGRAPRANRARGTRTADRLARDSRAAGDRQGQGAAPRPGQSAAADSCRDDTADSPQDTVTRRGSSSRGAKTATRHTSVPCASVRKCLLTCTVHPDV